MRRYGPLARSLHRLTLSSRAVLQTTLDAELARLRGRLPDVTGARHVFVCGLARAGTTVLMRALHATGAFSSLTYRDMPLVLAPNLWAALSGPFRKQADGQQERAQADGVDIGLDSPEALEEVFWRACCGAEYIHARQLCPHAADEETISRYRQYVAAVMHRYGHDRYLAKNNNSVLRLPTLWKALPNALVLVPFREPRAQAFSLLRQHRRFCQLQKEDAFVRRYMTWLGHHEFGRDHRPFRFHAKFEESSNPESLDYWLQRWLDAYEHLLQTAEPPAGCLHFIAYETLCAQPAASWRSITAAAGLPAAPVPPFRQSATEPPPAADAQLLRRATTLYQALTDHANQ